MKIKTISANAFNYAQILSNILDEYTQLLKEHMGVSLFIYTKAFFDNSFIHSSNDFQVTQSQIKYSLKNANPLFYESLLGKKSNLYAITWPKALRYPIMHCFKNLGYVNGINIIRFQEDGTEVFCFASDLCNTEIRNFYSKNYEALIKFSEYFTHKHNKILQANYNDKIHLVKNPIPINLDHKLDSQLKQEQLKIRKFFDSILQPSFNLSNQEYRCVEILAQGRTMKEAGNILNISPRTVESYVKNIKEKTGCNFKSQILDMFFEDRLTTKNIL